MRKHGNFERGFIDGSSLPSVESTRLHQCSNGDQVISEPQSENPKGISPQSPTLRGTSYVGLLGEKVLNRNAVATNSYSTETYNHTQNDPEQTREFNE
jgi:hypothetical protein